MDGHESHTKEPVEISAHGKSAVLVMYLDIGVAVEMPGFQCRCRSFSGKDAHWSVGVEQCIPEGRRPRRTLSFARVCPPAASSAA